MASSQHLIKSGDDKKGFTAYCGHKQFSTYQMTRYEGAIDMCPKCSSKFYAEKTKTDFPYRLGERLNLATDSRRHKFKSIYEIIRNADNAVIGFVAIKSGWGNAWYVYPWTATATMADVEANDIPSPNMAIHSVRFKRESETAFEGGGTFASKEQALFAVPTMVTQGKLPSRDEVAADVAATVRTLRANLDAQKAHRQHVKAERESKMRQIAEEFSGMIAGGNLTNAQNVALTTAAELLGVKL